MKLADTQYDNSETGCCARLDTKRWDDRTLHWDYKPFLKDHVRAFLHIPLNYGAVMSRNASAIEAAEAYPEEPFWLTDDVSPWRSTIYTAVDGDVPNTEIEQLSGTFITKVFEGPYRDAGKWMRKMKAHVSNKGYDAQKIYAYYATCPKCSKHFGQNNVVLLARVE